MTYEKPNKGKRVRAVIYCRDSVNEDNLYFLLFKRKSDIHKGWEFLKGGVEEESLESALYREIREEAKGIEKEHIIGEPKFINVPDALAIGPRIERIYSYGVEIINPPPDVYVSDEHDICDWFNLKRTFELLITRPPDRLRDNFVFPHILLTEFPEQYKQARKKGYL